MQSEGRWDDDDVELLPVAEGSGLDAVSPHDGGEEGGDHDDAWDTGIYHRAADQTQVRPDVSFTVSNPAGTLSATAGLGGGLQRVHLTDVTQVDEARLGEEIITMAALASEKARSAQHEVTVELMRRLGQDGAAVRSLLVRCVGLPTAESANSRIAEVISARYRSYDD